MTTLSPAHDYVDSFVYIPNDSFVYIPNDRIENPLVQLLMIHGGSFDRRFTSHGSTDDALDAAEANGQMEAAISMGFVRRYRDPKITRRREQHRDCVYTLCPAVGMGATLYGWTDRHPYEIIDVTKTGLKITLRAMHAEPDPSWKADFHPGGFVGHTSNLHSLNYHYQHNSGGAVITASRNKLGVYKSHGEFVRIGKAYKFYDSNF